MFTSRAEYRLSLREDNADFRLTEMGRQLGLVDDARWDFFSNKRDAVQREISRLAGTRVSPRTFNNDTSEKLLGTLLERDYSLADLLKRPSVTYATLTTAATEDGSVLAPVDVLSDAVKEQVEIQVKYAGYIARQQEEVTRQSHLEEQKIPADLDYDSVASLSFEVRQKLKDARPETVGQARRISGVTPAAISILLIHLKRLQLSAKTLRKTAPITAEE